MITYKKPTVNLALEVRLDGKHVGSIFEQVGGRFAYVPKGISVTSPEVNWFPTLSQAKADIEGAYDSVQLPLQLRGARQRRR